MRVAVVTPYHNESSGVLLNCIWSVAAQTYHDITHIMVSDGHPAPLPLNSPTVESIHLPVSHRDAGATPRAIGAISAFSRGYDAVAFLDADNTYEPSHIELMVNTMRSTGAQVVTATRVICTTSGEPMYVDETESNGVDFCDTNCIFLGKSTLHLLTYWVTNASLQLWSDRRFWSSIVQSGIQKNHCTQPTVRYNTRWAWHYQNAGREPPLDSVWIDSDQDGNLIHTKHSETKKGPS